MSTDAETEATAEIPRDGGPDSRGAAEASRDPARPKHRPESGWPFWWRWVLATNLGWFPGIFLGLSVANLLVDPSAVTKACLAALVASSFYGATQAFSLRHTLARPSLWFGATVVGWTTGIAVGRLLLDAASADLDPTLDAAAVAFIAGFVVGITQARLLSSCTRRWLWWPLISAAGWAALFPGALPGIGLVWLTRSGSASHTE